MAGLGKSAKPDTKNGVSTWLLRCFSTAAGKCGSSFFFAPLNCERTDDAGPTRRNGLDLLREVEMMRKASSPFVIKVLGVVRGRKPSSQPAQVGLVMELMERGSLASLQVAMKYFNTLSRQFVG